MQRTNAAVAGLALETVDHEYFTSDHFLTLSH